MKVFTSFVWYEKGGKALKPEIEAANHWNMTYTFGGVRKKELAYLKWVQVKHVHTWEVS